jgi:hypothetical protein
VVDDAYKCAVRIAHSIEVKFSQIYDLYIKMKKSKENIGVFYA